MSADPGNKPIWGGYTPYELYFANKYRNDQAFRNKVTADNTTDWKSEGRIYGLKKSAATIVNTLYPNFKDDKDGKLISVPLINVTHKEPFFERNKRIFNNATFEGQLMFEGMMFYGGMAAGELFAGGIAAYESRIAISEISYADEIARGTNSIRQLTGDANIVGRRQIGYLYGGIDEGIAPSIRGASEVNKGINLEQRAKEIHSALDEFSQSKRTTAVGRVQNADGTEQILVGSSQRRLSRAQREMLNSNEIEAIGDGHAEVTIINQAKTNGQTVVDIAASRPICPNCADAIGEVGANPVSPLKKVKR